MGGRERDGGALKSALIVAGGLTLAWVTMETAFKPWLDRLRAAMSRSDPAADPDDAAASAPAPAAGTSDDPIEVDDTSYGDEESKLKQGIHSSE